jgi:hypothetical protein
MDKGNKRYKAIKYPPYIAAMPQGPRAKGKLELDRVTIKIRRLAQRERQRELTSDQASHDA